MRLLLALFLALALAGCAGEMERSPDSSGSGSDYNYAWPESGQPDSFPWGGGDSSPWPSGDSYSGGTFGCASDSDCFGLRCCPTPWGVKLCAASCSGS